MKTMLAPSRFAGIRQRRRGFTMLELVVVLAIMALMIGIGAVSFAFINEKDPFEEPTVRLQQMSKFAIQAAVLQHRGMIIAFDKTGFGLLGETSGAGGRYTLPANMKMKIFHWGGKDWEKSDDQVWPFGEQGICEPIKVRFQTDTDYHDVAFHPLTGSPVPQ